MDGVNFQISSRFQETSGGEAAASGLNCRAIIRFHQCNPRLKIYQHYAGAVGALEGAHDELATAAGAIGDGILFALSGS